MFFRIFKVCTYILRRPKTLKKSPTSLKIICNVKTNWDIFSNFSGLYWIYELWSMTKRLATNKKKTRNKSIFDRLKYSWKLKIRDFGNLWNNVVRSSLAFLFSTANLVATIMYEHWTYVCKQRQINDKSKWLAFNMLW